MRRVGSAALDCAWTAAGRFDGYWENVVNAWDVAAGALIAAEAGAIVTDVQGAPFKVDVGNILMAAPGTTEAAGRRDRREQRVIASEIEVERIGGEGSVQARRGIPWWAC